MLCTSRLLEKRCLFHFRQLQWRGQNGNTFALMQYYGGKCNNISQTFVVSLCQAIFSFFITVYRSRKEGVCRQFSLLYLLLVIDIRIQTTEFRPVVTGFVFEAYVLQLSPLVSCFQ